MQQLSLPNYLVTNEGRKTPTECAIEAGYDKDTSILSEHLNLRNHQKSIHWLLNTLVRLEKSIKKKYDVDYGKHIAELG